jgi:uridylate kinase
MDNKKRILLKLTGEAFVNPATGQLAPDTIVAVINQIRLLNHSHQFGLVVGGGNFFRGHKEGRVLGMTPSSGHQVGILATMLNGIILKDLLEQHDISTTIFCALECPTAGKPISQQSITAAVKKDDTIIFTGGTGNPFFTTDTNAILRGLQMEAAQVWKGTKVDGVYDKDPNVHTDARRYDKLTYLEAITKKLGIMDPPAFALAQQFNTQVRVFNIFEPQALLNAAQDDTFGTLITN